MHKNDIEYSELNILKEAKTQNINAFKILLIKNEKRILKNAFWLLGNKEDGFDIVQDTFIYDFEILINFVKKVVFLLG